MAVVIMFVGTSLSAAPVIEEDNSNCVSKARVAAVADHFDEHTNDDLEFYLEIYDAVYLDCYLNV
ncbi:hypothetical protein H7F37_11040 [Winogradskyella sp. PAMC22761]|nr:hypothetical protein H7F37_11040 [Winogradskyella sp. PAMC22761]